jgi:hypothetical protein
LELERETQTTTGYVLWYKNVTWSEKLSVLGYSVPQRRMRTGTILLVSTATATVSGSMKPLDFGTPPGPLAPQGSLAMVALYSVTYFVEGIILGTISL